MTKFKEYIRWLTAEKFADSMSLNCMGCPAYPCTTSTEDIPDTGDECYERLLAWCNEDDGTIVINDDMKQRLLDAAKLALYRGHEDRDFVDRTEVESVVLAGLVELVQRLDPVKPENDAFGHPCCPKCKVLAYKTWNYCPHCGQELKWDD